jgi:nucleoside-diphosphate-sugar epimerase
MQGKSERSIILTGATGFLGAFLMSSLLERGYQVTVLGRPSKTMRLPERLSVLTHWLNIDPGERLSAIEVDFSKKHLGLDNKVYLNLCANAGKIIHCASDTSFAERNRNRVVNTNVNSLLSLLDLVVDGRAEHLYYVSTAYACGKCEGICMETPVTTRSFNNVYEESKAQAEEIIRRSCEANEVPLSIVRPSIVYGDSKTGKSLKFNALYYAVKSISFIRDIFINDIRQGRRRSGKWGFSLDDDGLLYLPLKIYLTNRGSVNLIPIDYFVATFLDIIEHPGTNGIYHITSDNPPDISTLAEYCERFLGVRGIQVLWNQSGKNTNPNPAEELFNKLFEQYRPYLSDNRIFDQSRTQTLTQGAPAPLFTYNIFEKCMAYAVACDWGNIRGFPK